MVGYQEALDEISEQDTSSPALDYGGSTPLPILQTSTSPIKPVSSTCSNRVLPQLSRYRRQDPTPINICELNAFRCGCWKDKEAIDGRGH